VEAVGLLVSGSLRVWRVVLVLRSFFLAPSKAPNAHFTAQVVLLCTSALARQTTALPFLPSKGSYQTEFFASITFSSALLSVSPQRTNGYYSPLAKFLS